MTGQPQLNRMPRKAMSILFGILVGSATIHGVPAAGAAPLDPLRATVRYELTGSGVAGYVTYQTNNGQQHATNVSLPWAMQFTGWMFDAVRPGATYLVSAQGAGPGSITCKVLISGKVVAQNTATGDPARVLCETHKAADTGGG
ncbi:MAG: MmpS family transport accessory protein [Mycobacterium sp.]